MIQIYTEKNTDFSRNGDMVLLPDEASAKAELNGAWNLSIHHPIDATGRWKYIEEGAVLKAPFFNGEQLFRIFKKEKNDSGVYAEAHPIFFDAKNDCFLVDTRPTGKTGQEALNIMCASNKKYSAQSNITKASTAYYEHENLLEAINGNKPNSFLNRWGGEVLYDNFKVIVNDRVGGDYGVELLYGKNIPADGISETVDMSEVVTRIYPKSYNGYKLSGQGYVDSPLLSNYPTVRAVAMKFDNVKMRADAQESDVENGVVVCDTQADLDKALIEQCRKKFASGIDKPRVTIEADMILLQDTDQYKDYKILEAVSLGDTIHCKHKKLGIASDARVIVLEYDCIQKKVISVVLGQFQGNYLNKVTSAINRIDSVISDDGTVMADRVKGILDAMNTQLRLQSTVAKKVKGRAFTVEDLDPNSPLYGCMAWGTQGFQIANKRTADNRDWDWRTAATAKGFVADAIVTGVLSDKTGTNYWDLDKGIFKIKSTSLNVDGHTIEQIAQAEADKQIHVYAEGVTKSLQDLQKQVDGQVEDWYYDHEPTMRNEPASLWTTSEERQKHIGDRFFWKSKGYAYRFMQNNNAWGWVLLKDTDITAALQNAAEAKDTADGKRRTFVIKQPIPPYDVGDIWVDGNDILTCLTARLVGEMFESRDWRKVHKYTDLEYITTLRGDIEKQIDGKIETFNQIDDPSLTWNTAELKTKHTGDLWYNLAKEETCRWDGTAWQKLTDAQAKTAEKLAKTKAQVFAGAQNPVPPYYVGDLWFTGTDIYTCKTTKETGEYAVADWTLQQDYQTKKQVDASIEVAKGAILLTAGENAQTYVDGQLKSYSTTAQIKILTDAIDLEVAKKVDSGEIISKINQSAEAIKIQADKLNLIGYATFSDLATSGRTTINGANITTGKINCNMLDGGEIKGQKINGCIIFGGRVSANGLEVYGDTGIGQPYIDFHRDPNAKDWSARILEQSAGNLIAFNKIANGSDRRIKKEIVNIDDRYLELFNILEPKQYRYRKGDAVLNLGFIAQEVDEALDKIGIVDKPIVIKPECTDPTVGNAYYALNYDDFIPILWKKIQQLERKMNNVA